MNPFLRWVGGKRWLASTLAEEILAHKPTRYIEPFVGAGAVALKVASLNPSIMIEISDPTCSDGAVQS